jgi:hypothetical protein
MARWARPDFTVGDLDKTAASPSLGPLSGDSERGLQRGQEEERFGGGEDPLGAEAAVRARASSEAPDETPIKE